MMMMIINNNDNDDNVMAGDCHTGDKTTVAVPAL